MFDYLSKSSKYRKYITSKDKLLYRSWNDITIITSFVYIIPVMFCIQLHEYILASLSLFTFIGSLLYHRHREMCYFNFDNIFATSQFIMITWCLILMYFDDNYKIIFYIGAIGLFLAAYLLYSCGMPGIVTIQKNKSNTISYQRESSNIYANIHSLWHFISFLGPIISSWYYSSSNIRVIYGINNFIPLLSLGIAIIINIFGNSIGIMPLD